MSKEEKARNLYRKTMSKKTWIEHCKKDRGELMPRPVVFEDKRYKNKHKGGIKNGEE